MSILKITSLFLILFAAQAQAELSFGETVAGGYLAGRAIDAQACENGYADLAAKYNELACRYGAESNRLHSSQSMEIAVAKISDSNNVYLKTEICDQEGCINYGSKKLISIPAGSLAGTLLEKTSFKDLGCILFVNPKASDLRIRITQLRSSGILMFSSKTELGHVDISIKDLARKDLLEIPVDFPNSNSFIVRKVSNPRAQ